MFINPPEIWFGSDLSLVNYLQRHELSPPAQLYAIGKDDDDDEDEDDDPFEIMAAKLIERYESVGVVNVTGSLVSTESRFNWWFGDLAYPTIQLQPCPSGLPAIGRPATNVSTPSRHAHDLARHQATAYTAAISAFGRSSR
jgi:hypothetical protein